MAQRKRGGFSYDEPEPDDGVRKKKVRFPKGKKESQKAAGDLNVIFEGEEGHNPIKSTDPRVAATERAVKRSEAVDHRDDTSLPTDVYEAEEDFEDSDKEGEDETSLEPFNLKQEREEGYFDEHGNYVEYINENEKDAWLDSVQVDTSVAAKHFKKYKEEEVELVLQTKDLAAIKRRIADALQPGETVLKALRRLKATATETDKYSKTKMSVHTKKLFDTLTEDAMALLDHGEYNVYHEKKETFDREAEGYEALVRAKGDNEDFTTMSGSSTRIYGEETFASATISASNKEGHSQGSDSLKRASMDMFAEDEKDIDEKAIGETDGQDNSSQVQGYANDSGYVYDETTGYYYNSTLGYYYDSNTGLFCNSTSGQWYEYDAERDSYTEIVEAQPKLE